MRLPRAELNISAGCGTYGENIDDGSHSVAYEKCNFWQHSRCLGIAQEEAEKDDFHFICADCKRKEEESHLPKIPPLLLLQPLSARRKTRLVRRHLSRRPMLLWPKLRTAPSTSLAIIISFASPTWINSQRPRTRSQAFGAKRNNEGMQNPFDSEVVSYNESATHESLQSWQVACVKCNIERYYLRF